jgi:PAS domain S-box-containing protein
MPVKKISPKEDSLQKEIASHKIETSLLSDAYFQLKETTKELQESEEKFSAAFHAAPYLMAITNFSDGKIFEVNEGYSKLLGYSREESLGKTTSELSIWADPKDRATFAGNLEKFGEVNDFETTLRRKDGTIAYVLDSARTIILKGEKCILSIAHDITERRRLEVENIRINRALRMLGEVNQALIHVVDEVSLLNKVCQTITKVGDYQSVWIGFVENTKEKGIRPVSYVGYEPGYLESLKLTWADNERGSGPEGVAIRAGKPIIKRNIATDPEMAMWREDALKHGYQSVIALPLMDKDKEFGVLNIYSDKSNAFDDEEAKVLEELANDLAFGIVSLRINVEYKLLEEELLKASADRYKALFIASRDAIMTLEPPTWNFTSGNPTTVAMFGAKSEGDFLNHSPWELSPEFQPDGRKSVEKAKDMINKVMSEGTNFFEWTHERLNGEEFPAEISLSRVEMNNKTFLQAVVRDITLRKKMEKQLSDYAEEKFKVIFDNTSDGMVLADAKTKKFFLGNTAFSKMLGYSPEEITKLGVEEIHPKEDLSFVMNQFDRQLRGEIKIARNLPVKRKDGSIFYCDVNSSPVTLGGIQYLLGIFRDATDRRLAEKTLEESEEKFSAAFHTAPYMILITKAPDGTIIDANEGYTRLSGYTREESLGKTTLELPIWANPEDRTAFVDGLKKFGELTDFETRLRRKDGTIATVINSVRSVTINGEKCFLSIGTDITERKQLDEAKSGFLSIASHQLRTPLSMTKWVLESLIEQGSLNPKQQKKLGDLTYSNERLIHLVNNLLKVSTIDSGKLVVNKKSTNLAELVEGLLSSIDSLAKEKGKNIKIDNFSNLQNIDCDPLLIYEALENLLVNAINYSPRDSKVINIEAVDQPSEYLISVHNDGMIDQVAIEKILKFEKFVRGTEATDMSPSGSGLGLYITKKLIEESGGKLWLESNAKSGTTFYFTIVKK